MLLCRYVRTKGISDTMQVIQWKFHKTDVEGARSGEQTAEQAPRPAPRAVLSASCSDPGVSRRVWCIWHVRQYYLTYTHSSSSPYILRMRRQYFALSNIMHPYSRSKIAVYTRKISLRVRFPFFCTLQARKKALNFFCRAILFLSRLHETDTCPHFRAISYFFTKFWKLRHIPEKNSRGILGIRL